MYRVNYLDWKVWHGGIRLPFCFFLHATWDKYRVFLSCFGSFLWSRWGSIYNSYTACRWNRIITTFEVTQCPFMRIVAEEKSRPGLTISRDSLRSGSVLENVMSIYFSPVFVLVCLFLFLTWIHCFCVWLCSNGADKVWRHWRQRPSVYIWCFCLTAQQGFCLSSLSHLLHTLKISDAQFLSGWHKSTWRKHSESWT